MSRSVGALALLGLLVACSDSSGDTAATSAATTDVLTTVQVSVTAAPATSEAPSTSAAVISASGDPEVNYSLPAGNFEAYFPTEPAVIAGSPTWVESDGSNGYYAVSFSPYETTLTADDMLKFALAADHMVTSTYGGTLTESIDVERDGISGHQARGFTDTDDVWVTLWADGLRLYTVVSVVLRDVPQQAEEATGFHSHFHVIGADR